MLMISFSLLLNEHLPCVERCLEWFARIVSLSLRVSPPGGVTPLHTEEAVQRRRGRSRTTKLQQAGPGSTPASDTASCSESD